MSDLDRQQALRRATEHIFSMGLGDVAAQMSTHNMAYGLAKMHHVLHELGHPSNALFIGTPDLTITRNENRWNAGIGYGGKLVWGDGTRPVVFLDPKPNCCGMLVGGLAELPTLAELTRRLDAMLDDRAEIDGIRINWDIGTGNHFVDLMAVEAVDPAVALPSYCFVLHFSGSELRAESALGPGLYWDESAELRRRMKVFETPWGPCRALLDADAMEYWKAFQRAEEFVRQRRLMAAERLFDDFTVIANLHHQGLSHQNAMLLGCQDTSGGGLVPVMLRESTPSYLFHPLPNLADDVIEVLGWGERAERHGLIEELRHANVIPHGAGYMLPGIARFVGTHEIGERRYYEVEAAEGGVRIMLGTPRDLTFAYRGRRVILASTEYRLGRIAARLQPLSVLKA